MSASGAAAPNHTAVARWSRAARTTRAVAAGVGTSSPVGCRVTGNGWTASNPSAPGDVEAYTASSPGAATASRTARLCTNDWMPPWRGGKSLVTISVRRTRTSSPRAARRWSVAAGQPMCVAPTKLLIIAEIDCTLTSSPVSGAVTIIPLPTYIVTWPIGE